MKSIQKELLSIVWNLKRWLSRRMIDDKKEKEKFCDDTSSSSA